MDAIARSRRWLRRRRWIPALFAFVYCGCVADVERSALDGRPCPCLPGWVCDASQGEAAVCVRPSAELADDLRNTSNDVLGAGSSGSSGAAGSSSSGGSGSSEATGCAAAATPAGAACPALCDECVQGTCIIRCNDDRQCQGSSGSPSTLACPPGFHCAVSCESDGNCSFLNVECPGDHACSTHCTGKKACNELSLACAGGPCSLVCESGSQICRNSQLRCGTGACQASCAGNELPTVTGCAASCSAQCGC